MTILNRFKAALHGGKFTYDEEIGMAIALLEKLQPLSLTQYAHKEGISKPGALKRIQAEKVAYFETIGRKFILD